MADLKTTLTRLLTALAVSDPTWDTSVGSATYKIMESVAQELSSVTNNSTLLSFGYSISTKAGTELDAFVNLFGINRQQGTRATGYVTFSTNVSAVQNYQIPLGVTVYAPSSISGANIAFTTTSPAVLSTGQTSVQVPVIAVLPGSQGNIQANTVTNVATALQGITSVVNESNFSYGTDTETDAQLRQRFINTAFSNFAGTDSKFQSVARQLPTTNRVNVIGSQEAFSDSLSVFTVLSGNADFKIGLNTQAILYATSGSATASLVSGQLPIFPSMTVVSGNNWTTTTGTVTYDGTNYKLNITATGTGNIFVNYTLSGTTVYSGTSAASYVASGVNVLLSSGGYSQVSTTTTGNTASGVMGVTFSQGTPWNLVVTSGTVSGTNSITSQVPDAKYVYPAGGETVGTQLGTTAQTVWTNNLDYVYTQPTGTAPIYPTVKLTPSYTNAPYTFTGQMVQMITQYIPISSRVVTTTTGSIVNAGYVDIFIDDTVTSTVSEQIVMNTNNTITASGGGGTYSADKFLMGNGAVPPSGDYYLDILQGPVANFPNQIIPGVSPSYVTFGVYQYPVSLTLVTGVAISGITGTSGNNYITTTQSISGLQTGLVASGSLLGIGNYITNLSTGTPNTITLANNLASGITTATGITWVSVAYPVYDTTTNAGSILDLTGIALRVNDPTGAYGTSYPKNINYQPGVLSHGYYSNVSTIDNVEQQSRTVGTNLLVHEASWVNLQVNLSIVYNTTNTITSVNSSIQNAIGSYLNNVPIGGKVAFGGILQAVYQVQGVGTARITSSGDNAADYGVVVLNPDGSDKTIYTNDWILNANQVPRLFTVNYKTYGFNNF